MGRKLTDPFAYWHLYDTTRCLISESDVSHTKGMSLQLIDFSKPQPYVKYVLNYVKSGEALDLGAGSGRNTRFLADHGFEVTAIDDDKEAIAGLRKYRPKSKRSVKLIHADIRDWRSESCRYDLVLCTMVLHFLTNEQEFRSVLTRIQDATKDGGINVISVYTNRNQAGVRPYLIAPTRLGAYYHKWALLDTYEGLGRPYRTEGVDQPVRDYVERVTAQK